MYIAHRGFSEEALVLPIELAWTFVSHREGCTRSIEFLGEHLLPCCTEPKLFLKLKRTHCRETTEVMMQSWSAHTCHRCKLIHIQRLLEVFTQPSDRLSRSIALVLFRCNRTQTTSLGPLQKPVDDFSLEQLAKERDIQVTWQWKKKAKDSQRDKPLVCWDVPKPVGGVRHMASRWDGFTRATNLVPRIRMRRTKTVQMHV